MKYAYEDLSDTQFEGLIILLCARLLGISVQGFSEGPDGGRDGKFVGMAELHPSKAAPWTGTTIIQAKHTNGYNRHFAESDFFNSTSEKTVIGEEIPRITKLRKAGQLDHYMLFSNRRLAGTIESCIRAAISKKCDIPEGSIYLCGVEQLEMFMKQFPETPEMANLDPLDSPLIVSPDELCVVVEAFARERTNISSALDQPPSLRMGYEEKNKLNHMSFDYGKALQKKYLKETSQIQKFLAAPENMGLLRKYEAVVEEFQMKIISKRKDFQTFDEVMEHLLDLLFNRDAVLRQHAHKRLTRALLFYMYWHCDIGKEPDVKAD